MTVFMKIQCYDYFHGFGQGGSMKMVSVFFYALLTIFMKNGCSFVDQIHENRLRNFNTMTNFMKI